MTETVADAVGESTAPDANVSQQEANDADAKSAEPGNEAESSPAVKEDSDEEPALKGVSKRIDELTRYRREAERDRDYWRDLAMRQSSRETREPERQQREDPAQPKTLADFGHDETQYRSYLLAEAKREAKQAISDELRQERERQAEERRKSEFSRRTAKFAKSVDDYHEVVSNPSLPINKQMAEVIAESDEGPALAYYLGKHLDEAREIAEMPPLKAASRLGSLEARIIREREKSKEKEIVSKAPAPPPKIDAAAADLKVSPADPDSDKLSTEDWLKRRNKQVASRNKR